MKKKRAESPATPPIDASDLPKLSRYQGYEVVRMKRADWKAAPYNPRYIDPYARKELEAVIRRMKLLGPPTINKRTGNIVGGHQRLDLLDGLHGDDNYSLDVAVVDMTDEEEREANLVLNNRNLQGDWDLDKLGGMIREGLDYARAGFSETDMHGMFDGSTFAQSMFDIANHAEQVAGDMATMGEIASSGKTNTAPQSTLVASSAEDGRPLADRVPESAPARATKTDEEKRAEVQQHRAEFRAAAKERNADADTGFTATIVCADRAERDALLAFLGCDSPFIDSRKLRFRLGMKEPPL